MQSKLQIALSSPAFWSIVAIFALNGLNAVVPMLSGSVATIANVLLLALAAYTHTSAVQSAGNIQK